MAYRFTNTEKWQDVWFSNLSQIEMLLFMYLCDNCDIAGFIEINLKRWASDLSSSTDTIKGALKGLDRGLIISKCGECVYIRNFLKHQKNYPLNEKNKAHLGIIRRFDLYSYKFNIKDINEFLEGASKGLPSPTGIGIGIGKGINKEGEDFLKQRFETYKNHLQSQTVIDRLCMNSPVRVNREQSRMVMNEFIETCYGDLCEKNTKLQAEQYFINWVKKENKASEALNNQIRKNGLLRKNSTAGS
jgi:hypothetical protein